MTDWTTVRRAVFRVRQHYRYTYSGAVWDLRHRLVMVPRDEYRDQRVVQYDLEVRGTEGDHAVRWERDRFGNRIARVMAARVPRAIDFEARFRAERSRRDDDETWVEPAPWGDKGPTELLEHTALTAPDERIEAAARKIADETRDRRIRAFLAFEWTSHAIRYQYGVTGYTTPAAMALHLGRGVCQDFAHIYLSVARLLGVPCRYVSGHLVGEGAPHAWVEALIPEGDGVEVLAYDPTHQRVARMDYLTVAVGRDFADVSPTSGTYGGPAVGKLAASKSMQAIETEGGQDTVEAVVA